MKDVSSDLTPFAVAGLTDCALFDTYRFLEVGSSYSCTKLCLNDLVVLGLRGLTTLARPFGWVISSLSMFDLVMNA